MRYIQFFEEVNFNRDIKTSYRIKDNLGGELEYTFYFNQRLFSVKFNRIKRGKYISEELSQEIILFERSYGIRYANGVISTSELGLKQSKLLDLLTIITNITLDFIKNYNPDIILIKHVNMDQEDVPFNKWNKRSKLNYQFLKDKIPSGYKLSYYAKGNEHFSDVTMCYIYKNNKEDDIVYLNKWNVKLL